MESGLIKLETFLLGAPKAIIHEIFKRGEKAKGLVSNAEVLQKTLYFLSSSERVYSELDALDGKERLILQIIYLSGDRGIDFESIMVLFHESERTQLKFSIDKMLYSLLIYRSSSNKGHYFGFYEYKSMILEKNLLETKEIDGLKWNDNASKSLRHLQVMAASVLSGSWNMTQLGEIHRRNLNSVEKKILPFHALGSDACVYELERILDFFLDYGFVYRKGKKVELNWASYWEWVNKAPLDDWERWLFRSYPISYSALNSHLEKMHGDYDVCEFAEFLGAFSTSACREEYVFFNLPDIIKDLWILGWIHLGFSGDRIVSIRVPTSKSGRLTSFEAHASYFLPNFEVRYPSCANWADILILELVGLCQAEEEFLCYQLDKSSFLQALQFGVPAELFRAFFYKNNLPPNVLSSVEEWFFSYEGASFHSVLYIKINKKSILDDLKSMPEVQELCVGYVGDQGLIIDSRKEQILRRILSSFGIEPPELPSSDEASSDLSYWNSTNRKSLIQVSHDPDYQMRKPIQSPLRLGEMSKYGGHFQDLDFNQKLRVIEYSILTDAKMELVLENMDRFVLRPANLDRTKSPILLEGKTFPAGASTTILIENIQKLRVIS
jgi:hypothetical protein